MSVSTAASAHPLSVRVPRIDSLTGLRWWAAFGVFLFHMNAFAPLPNPVFNVAELGHFGVAFFFVLSGFVLVVSARPGVPRSTFYWRRIARIYPSAFVTLLIALPVFTSFDPDPAHWWVHPVDPGIIALNFPLLQGWWRDPVILFSGNPAAWTLTCEFFFYAIFPFVLAPLIKLRPRGAQLAIVGAIGLLAVVGIGAHLWPEVFAQVPIPILRAPEFLLGMAVGWAVRSGWRPKWASPMAAYALTAIIVLILSFPFLFAWLGPIPGIISLGLNEVIVTLCALLILATAVNELNGRGSLMRKPLLVTLGAWSYAFYLVHATVMYTFMAVIGERDRSWSNIVWYVAVLAVALVLTAMVHYWVEVPCERRMRAWKDRRDQLRMGTI